MIAESRDPPKYTGRKFVNPLYSKKYGRRTGRDVLAGKTVRVDEDGLQNFDDYLSESDLDVTRERVLMRSIHEERESQLSNDSGKENVALQANVSVSQSVPNRSALVSQTMKSVPNQSSYYDSSISQSQLSQGGKINNRSRFGWLRNKNIGRRTGKDVVAGKQIRRDEDGMEIFDDYLSPSSGTESFLSQSSANSQRRSQGRPGSANNNVHEDNDNESGNDKTSCKAHKSQLSPQTFQDDKLSDVRSNSPVEQQDDCVAVEENDNSENENNEVVLGHENLENENNEMVNGHESDEVSEEESGNKKDGNEDIVKEDENDTFEEEPNIRSDSRTSRRQTSNQSRTAYSNDFESEFKSYVEDVQKSRNAVAGVKENKSDVSSRHSEQINQSCSESDSENENVSVAEPKKVLRRKSGANISHRSASDKGKLVSNHDTENDWEVNNKKESHTQSEGPVSDKRQSKQSLVANRSSNRSINLSYKSVHDKSVSIASVATNKKIPDRKQSAAQEMSGKKEYTAQIVHDNDQNNNEQSDENDDDLSDDDDGDDRQHNKTNKSGKIVQDDNHSQTSQKDRRVNEYEETTNGDGEDDDEEENNHDDVGDDDDDDIGPSSQTGIDVAGNRSGSITKLEAPDTSKVSFDKTRKRLSYSALEMSEEAKKARLSRVKEANQSLQEKSSKSLKTSVINRPSSSREDGGGKLNKMTANTNSEKIKRVSDKIDSTGSTNKPVDNRTGQAGERTRIGSEYYEPSDFVSLASVARRRSTFVAHKYESDNDSIEILDDSPKKKRKSVRGKKSVTNVKGQKSTEETETDVSKTRKSKNTVKSKRTKSNARPCTETVHKDKTESHENGVTANADENKNKRKGFIMTELPQVDNSVEEIYRRNIENIINLGDHHDSEIEIVEDFPKQKWGRKSASMNQVDHKKSIKDHHENEDIDNEVVDEDMDNGKKQKNENTAKKQSSKVKDADKSEAPKVKTTKTRTKSKDLKQNVIKDQNKKSRKISVPSSTKPLINIDQDVTENDNQDKIDNDKDIQQQESQSVPDNHALDPYELNEDDSGNQELYIEDDNVIGNEVEDENAIANAVDSDIVTQKIKKVAKEKGVGVKTKTKETNTAKSSKAKTSRLKRQEDTKSKAGPRKQLPSQSSIRSSRLKSGSSESTKNKALYYISIKRKNTDVLNEADSGEIDSVSKPKKSKISDSDTDLQQSAKRKLDFKKQQALLAKRKHKSLGVGSYSDREGKSSTPRRKSYHDKASATPPVNSMLTVPTNFNSGVSVRVSRRTELLDQIGSGYGNVPNMSIRENQPSENLTPCISKGGKSRKSRGHRVSICPVESTVFSDGHNSSSEITMKRKNRTRLSSLGTPLPSMSSSPKHYCEQSKPGTPKPGRKSTEYIKSRLIVPEPAPEGLRRSKRNRLPPVNWCHGERIVYARKNAYDWVILGVKESNEVKYNRMEEEKRKRRQLMNQIRKATQKDKSEMPKRKLSIHVELPEGAEPVNTSEISVPDASSAESMILNCIAKNDSRSPVGPHHGKPRKEDPYLIKKLIDQPLMSAGQLTIKPGSEKPPQIVDNAATVFAIHYGKLLVTVHNTTSLLETGDFFFVPFGCSYSIKNLRHDNAQLYYNVMKVPDMTDQVDHE